MWAVGTISDSPSNGKGVAVRFSQLTRYKTYPIGSASSIASSGKFFWINGVQTVQKLSTQGTASKVSLEYRFEFNQGADFTPYRESWVVSPTPGGGALFTAGQMDAHAATYVDPTIGSVSRAGKLAEQLFGSDGDDAPSLIAGVSDGTAVVASRRGEIQRISDGRRPAARPKVQVSGRGKRGRARVSIKCSGDVAAWCAGAMKVVGSHGKAVCSKPYALRGQSRTLVSCASGSLRTAMAIVSNVDTSTHASSSSRTRFRISAR
jgi:hypothetical protein